MNRCIFKNSFSKKKLKRLNTWKKFHARTHCLSTRYVRDIGFKGNIKIVKKKKETGSLKFPRAPDVSSHPSCNLCFIKFLSSRLGLILNRFGRRFEKFIRVFETDNVAIFRGKWMNERGELNSKGGRWKLRWRDSRFSRGSKNFTALWIWG